MVIRNKDGTIFELRGPNPLMKEQDQWGDFVLHNFEFQAETQRNAVPKVTPVTSDFKIKSTEFPKEEEAKPATPPPPPPEPEKIPVVESIQPSEEEKDASEGKVTVYCLPVVVKKYEDKLYGEVKFRNEYGAKFLFEAFLISQSDFMVKFWTDIDFIGNGSIVYPRNQDKRWWKVTKKEAKQDGYLYTGIPSELQPDFT